VLGLYYTQAVLKFTKLITEAQQREAVTRGRSLLPYRLRYKYFSSVPVESLIDSNRYALHKYFAIET
jgi:hypothetical protein